MEKLNPLIRGWRNYFQHGNSTKRFKQLDEFVWMKLWRRVYYRRKQKKYREHPTKFNTVEQTDAIVDEILADVKSSEPIKEDGEVLYPGELELKNIKENKEQGIPVVEEVWESVMKM